MLLFIPTKTKKIPAPILFLTWISLPTTTLYWPHPYPFCSLLLECYLSCPPPLLYFLPPVFTLSLPLSLSAWPYRGEVMREDPIWKFSQMLATEGGMFLKRSTRSLTLCQTPLSPPASSFLLLLLLLLFSLSFLLSQPKLLSGVLRLAANNGGVVWYHRLPEGAEAAERLSSKPKHLYSVIHLIIPHPSIPLLSASLSIIHLALIFLPVCQRGSAKMSAAWRGVCILCVCLGTVQMCVCECVCSFWWSE